MADLPFVGGANERTGLRLQLAKKVLLSDAAAYGEPRLRAD
jgi:hypothetical protein